MYSITVPRVVNLCQQVSAHTNGEFTNMQTSEEERDQSFSEARSVSPVVASLALLLFSSSWVINIRCSCACAMR